MLSLESPTAARSLPILRVQAGSVVQVELASTDFVRLVTHFYQGTVLCAEGDDCPLCGLLPARPYWYLPVSVVATGRPAILELSAAASSDLEQVARFAALQMAIGQRFDMHRRSTRAPVRFEFVSSESASRVADGLTWVSCLMRIFRMPELRPEETLELYGERIRSSVLQRAEVLAGRMRSGSRK